MTLRTQIIGLTDLIFQTYFLDGVGHRRVRKRRRSKEFSLEHVHKMTDELLQLGLQIGGPGNATRKDFEHILDGHFFEWDDVPDTLVGIFAFRSLLHGGVSIHPDEIPTWEPFVKAHGPLIYPARQLSNPSSQKSRQGATRQR